MTAGPTVPHVVIVGGGFGGLETAKRLAEANVRITLIDRRNHHLFQPLLYQVATASLSPSDVAWAIRSLVSKYKTVLTLLGEVVGVETDARTVRLKDGETIGYDFLVLATGARHAYFGHDDWEAFAPGLKTVEDGSAIRRRILSAFERAERTSDMAERAACLTFVVIGGGPTGVELAGTIAELAHQTLPGDFRRIDTRRARVVLIEAGPRILPGFKDDLSAYARKALERLGVEVWLDRAVTGCGAQGVEIGEDFLPAATILWAAGVAASPAADWLHAPRDRAGRVMVQPDLTAPGHPDVFVVGDTANVVGPGDRPVPGVAPAAKQEGAYVAEAILARIRGRRPPPPFAYKDVGSLATIGKRAAIVDFGWIRLKGRLAWWLWSVVHIYFLIGLRHRLFVALSWLWTYFTGQRGARLITVPAPASSPLADQAKDSLDEADRP